MDFSNIFTAENGWALLEKFGEALLILVIGWIFIRIVRRIERKALEKSALDRSVHTLIMRTTGIVLWILLILTILSKLGVDMAPLVTALAAAGVAVALALRDSLSNVAGGIILLFTKPFVAGDEVEINGTTGIVDRIDLLTTHLHTYDNRDIIVPNGNVTTSMVINASRRELRRVSGEFIISYDSDIDQARDAIRQVVHEGPMLLEEPEPWICLKRHGERGLVFDVGIWCRTENRGEALIYMEEAIKKEFDRRGIRIPYPHIEVTKTGQDPTR